MLDLICRASKDVTVAFKIGNLEVQWYGLILTSAMIVGLIYIMFQGKRIGLTKDDSLELFLWIIPLAVIFARFFYVVSSPAQYFPWNSWDDFVRAIAIWDGGITILGGVVGGVLGGIIFWARHKKQVNIGQLFDLVIPVLLLGQVIGRWGNFVNQEAYGIPIANTNLQFFPFAVFIEHCDHLVATGEYVKICTCGGSGWHAATFFYESFLNFFAVVFSYYVWKKNKKYPGILGFFYVAWYCLVRACMEFLRLDAKPITQPVCWAFFVIASVAGIGYIVWRNFYLKKNPEFAISAVQRGAKSDLPQLDNVIVVRNIDKTRGSDELSKQRLEKSNIKALEIQKHLLHLDEDKKTKTKMELDS